MPLRRVRSALFWVHLVIGLSAGLIILLMSATGVLLGFERQLIAAIDGVPAVVAPVAGPLPIDSVLTAVGSARGDVASIALRRDSTAPVTVRFVARDRAPALLDPYAGTLLPPRQPGKAQAFFSAVRRWHRWMGASDGALRTRLRAFTGAANLVFLVLVLSGLWLWWPRRWSPARLRATLVPSVRHHAGRARDFNWHNSLGFWSAVPLALIVASGAFISYQWPGRWLDRVLGSPAERAAATRPATAPRAGTEPRTNAEATRPDSVFAAPRSAAPIEPLLAAARTTRPEWKTLTLTLPADAAAPARATIAEGNTYRPDLRTTLVLDRSSGTVRETLAYADLSASRRIRAWVRFGHTGEVFGIPGQLVATLVSAVGVLLVYTGFALAWRRAAAFVRRRARRAPEALAGEAVAAP